MNNQINIDLNTNPNLIIEENSLNIGEIYHFRLDISSPSLINYNLIYPYAIKVAINIPSSGLLKCIPEENGIALDTYFMLETY